MRVRFFISALLAISFIKAQTFEMDQIEQLFRPRLKLDSRYIFDSRFADTSGAYNQKDAGLAFTFPLRTRLGADLNLTGGDNLKDILRNSVRIKASQTLGLIRVNGRQARFGFDSIPQKEMFNVTAGIMGLRLTRKFRVMFYSVNASVSEERRSVPGMVPRATALIGQLHVQGLRRNFFYGLAANYSDGLFLPVPFFGGSVPIGEKLVFNFTLPVQVNLQYKDQRRTVITLGVNADGYRSGILYRNARSNVNYASVSAYAGIRYKFSRSVVARVEGGCLLYQNLQYPTDRTPSPYNYNIIPGPYVQISASFLFGKTLWEKIFDTVGGSLRN